ncbi:hypothetical protein Ddye_029481 [Dipteronia dyeriana]|uniref:Uncharacterized protein n=1 Tax=Dipteronia dyeriana TaxID=168575 RepID=A0AAD9TEI2_9ROSI|nr:hypothetical protein Ddye_029481 [Dipteronia dyeriana]
MSPENMDGFDPVNMGNLAMRGREPLFIPCASKGCIELLLRSGVEIMGKKVADPSSRHGYSVTGDVCFEEATKCCQPLPRCLEVYDLL